MAARSRSEKRLEAAYNESQGRSLVQRKHTILRLGRYMIQYKWLLLLAFIMTVGSNLLALVGPMLSGYAIDAIEPGMGKVEFSRVFHYAGWMAAFYVMSALPCEIGESWEFKRFCGRDGNRTEDLKGLLPGGKCHSEICGEE